MVRLLEGSPGVEKSYEIMPNLKPKSARSSKMNCFLCHASGKPIKVYTSHNTGEFIECPSFSKQDKERLRLKYRNTQYVKTREAEEDFAKMLGYDDKFDEDKEYAKQFGYDEDFDDGDTRESTSRKIPDIIPETKTRIANCAYIRPVPSQILTMFLDSSNKNPIHIDLDSGATLNYVHEKEVLKNKFKIHPNGQMSKLGDGVTKLKSIGEIHETFFRNNWKVKFSAVVCKQLTAPFIGGTVFLKENGIDQDFKRDVIHINNKAITVQPTDPISLLPIGPVISNETIKKPPQTLFSFKSKILLPGQTEEVEVDQEDGTVVAIEPVEHNRNAFWPIPDLKPVVKGKISLINSSNEPIFLGKEVKQIRIRQTEEPGVVDSSFYPRHVPKLSNIEADNTSLVKM